MWRGLKEVLANMQQAGKLTAGSPELHYEQKYHLLWTLLHTAAIFEESLHRGVSTENSAYGKH
jgi:hypothetical protein